MARHDRKCECTRPPSLSIENLPVEIVCQIIESTIDLDDRDSLKHLAALISSSPRIYQMFRGYRDCIMLHLLQKEAQQLASCLAKTPKELDEAQARNRWWFLTKLIFHVQRFIYPGRDYYLEGNYIAQRPVQAEGYCPARRSFIGDFLRLEIFNLFGRNASGPHRGNLKAKWSSLVISDFLGALQIIRRSIYHYDAALTTDYQLEERLRARVCRARSRRCFVVMEALRGLNSGRGYYDSNTNKLKSIDDFVSDSSRWEKSGPSFDSNAWTLVFLGWEHA